MDVLQISVNVTSERLLKRLGGNIKIDPFNVIFLHRFLLAVSGVRRTSLTRTAPIRLIIL